MSIAFTLILAITFLIGLVIVFIATYAWKGLRTALIATAAALVIFAILYVAVIAVIASSMQ